MFQIVLYHVAHHGLRRYWSGGRGWERRRTGEAKEGGEKREWVYIINIETSNKKSVGRKKG